MTPEQIYALRHGGEVIYSSGSSCGALDVARCPPPNFNSLEPVEPIQPLTDKKFNHLSVNDVLFLAKTKHLDSYARADFINKDLVRGRAIRERVAKDGTANFLSSYKK